MMGGLVGLGGKSEPGTWCRVQATVGPLTALHAPSLTYLVTSNEGSEDLTAIRMSGFIASEALGFYTSVADPDLKERCLHLAVSDREKQTVM